MELIKIKLKDKSILKTEDSYLWDLENKLNDTRTAFVKIGSYTLNKECIEFVRATSVEEEEKENKEDE